MRIQAQELIIGPERKSQGLGRDEEIAHYLDLFCKLTTNKITNDNKDLSRG